MILFYGNEFYELVMKFSKFGKLSSLGTRSNEKGFWIKKSFGNSPRYTFRLKYSRVWCKTLFRTTFVVYAFNDSNQKGVKIVIQNLTSKLFDKNRYSLLVTYPDVTFKPQVWFSWFELLQFCFDFLYNCMGLFKVLGS